MADPVLSSSSDVVFSYLFDLILVHDVLWVLLSLLLCRVLRQELFGVPAAIQKIEDAVRIDLEQEEHRMDVYGPQEVQHGDDKQ